MPDRGQTETLGFALIFALMISSVVITFTAGYAGLQDVRDIERTNNAERAFEVFADNIGDIIHNSAPSRATEMKLSDARVAFDEPIRIRVADPDAGFNQSYTATPIVYAPNDPGRIAYEQGAVLRTRHSSGSVVEESAVVLNENRTLIPIIRTRQVSGTKASVGGDVTVLIRAIHVNTNVIHVNDSPNNRVWLNISSPRAAAWHAHLDDDPDVSCTEAATKTSCSVTTNRVHVTVVRIDVEFA